MYKLLLVSDQTGVLNRFARIENWREMGYLPISVVPNVDEAVAFLDANPVDAIGYALAKYAARDLYAYLLKQRPSLPIFQVAQSERAQRAALGELRKLLDRLHADYADDGYDETAMLDILRDELAHDLLSDGIADARALKERLLLVRSRVDPEKPCMVFDIDLPQGEVYLTDRWRYGRERLESAMRNNFFGRVRDGVVYHVVVLTPRSIRLLACQHADAAHASAEAFGTFAREHALAAIERIKEFLDLDLDVRAVTLNDDLFALTSERGK